MGSEKKKEIEIYLEFESLKYDMENAGKIIQIGLGIIVNIMDGKEESYFWNE